MQSGFDGRHADFECVRNLLEGIVQHVLQNDGAALTDGQGHEARQRGAHQLGICAGFLDRLLRELRDRLDEAALVATKKIQGRIVRDAKEPGPQRRQLRRQAGRVERLGERLLDHVLAVDRGAHQARAIAVQLGPQISDQGVELLANCR